jgi:hypothetical protein
MKSLARSKSGHIVLPRGIGITVRRLRAWRHAPTLLHDPRPGRRASAIVAAAVGRMDSRRRRPRRRATAPKVAHGVRRARAWRATPRPGELRHRDHLARADRVVEGLGDGPAVRVVEGRIGIVAVGLVGVEVGQRGDGVRVWELGCRVGCRGGCVSDRASWYVRSGIEAGSTRAVCWQGDTRIVRVELWPLYLLVCG